MFVDFVKQIIVNIQIFKAGNNPISIFVVILPITVNYDIIAVSIHHRVSVVRICVHYIQYTF